VLAVALELSYVRAPSDTAVIPLLLFVCVCVCFSVSANLVRFDPPLLDFGDQ